MADKNDEQKIRQAVSRAKQHYRKGEIKQALKLLAPYRDNEKVRNIIAGIQRRTQEAQPVKSKRQSGNVLSYILLAVLGVVIMIVIATIAASSTEQQNEPVGTAEPSLLPTTVIYYARNDGVRVRGCEFDDDSQCPVFDILGYGDPIEVTGTVTGGALNGNTLWYEVNNFGQILYVHSSFLLDAPPPTTRPPVSPQPAAPQSSGGSGSGTTNQSSAPAQSFTCDCSKLCPSMTCAEAQYQLNVCGCTARDNDGDGLACDSQCGG